MICQGYQTSYLYTIFIVVSLSRRELGGWLEEEEGPRSDTTRRSYRKARHFIAPFPIPIVHRFIFLFQHQNADMTSSLNFYYYFIIDDSIYRTARICRPSGIVSENSLKTSKKLIYLPKLMA